MASSLNCRLRRHVIKLVLGIDQYYYVTLSDENDSIRLAITPDEDGVVSIAGLQNRWNLIEFFSAKLREITTTFMPASAPPECYIPCSLCPNLHIRLDEIRANEMPLRCSRGRLTSDYYKSLRQYPGTYTQSIVQLCVTVLVQYNKLRKQYCL